LARWLRAHGVEAHVIHPSSVAVSREHSSAVTTSSPAAIAASAPGSPGCRRSRLPCLPRWAFDLCCERNRRLPVERHQVYGDLDGALLHPDCRAAANSAKANTTPNNRRAAGSGNGGNVVAADARDIAAHGADPGEFFFEV
jgi:hypothetical protein